MNNKVSHKLTRREMLKRGAILGVLGTSTALGASTALVPATLIAKEKKHKIPTPKNLKITNKLLEENLGYNPSLDLASKTKPFIIEGEITSFNIEYIRNPELEGIYDSLLPSEYEVKCTIEFGTAPSKPPSKIEFNFNVENKQGVLTMIKEVELIEENSQKNREKTLLC